MSATETRVQLGRGNVKLPTIELAEELHPARVTEFLREFWWLNVFGEEDFAEQIGFGADHNAWGRRTEPQDSELVLPESGYNPLTVVRFHYKPPLNRAHAPVETHTFLKPPYDENVGPFEAIAKFEHNHQPSSGSGGDRDWLRVYSTDEEVHLPVYHENDMSFTYRPEQLLQQANLARIMRGVVELLDS